MEVIWEPQIEKGICMLLSFLRQSLVLYYRWYKGFLVEKLWTHIANDNNG